MGVIIGPVSPKQGVSVNGFDGHLAIAGGACYRATRVRRYAPMFRRLLKSQAAQLAAARLLGLYLELALRSTRWTVEGVENLAPYLSGGAVIVAAWHERLPLIPALWMRSRRKHPGRQVAALASRHRDGRFLGSLLERFGVRIVHGSTESLTKAGRRRDRGGAAGVRALLAALAEGAAVVITPDGPRGPRRVAAPGVAQLGALAQAPVLPVSGQVRWRITLRSWDQMVLPLPFGRGGLVCGKPILVAEAAASLGQIETAMSAAADRADVLCGQ
jgi:lysophospholipid acyltransferase (LPLAT)-like uncharacterized protein